jgi:membrane bound O-acyltransferase family protein
MAEWPRWVVMWLLAAAIYAGCKWITWRRTPVQDAPWWKHAGYLFAWPGLDAAAFLGSGRAAQPSVKEWCLALFRFLVGILLFAVVAGRVPANHELIFGWVGMIGLILMLHFGTFHLLSCAWRSAGVDAQPLMNRPLTSTSLSEFWSRRWNTAFRDFTYRFLFRPLNTWCGPRWAIVLGFVFSGVVHDLVISVPAGGGYGGPTLFFGVQAIGILVERIRWRGRLFTMTILIAPAYVLFHPPFVRNIILPFMRALHVCQH